MNCARNRWHRREWVPAGLGQALALCLAGALPARAQQTGPVARPLVFELVTVVDVEQGKLRPDQRVVIAGNRIQAVGDPGAVKMPNGAQVVNAQGKYLIPGLWDMHVHPMQRALDYFYPLFLANGITGFRDGWSSVPLDTLRRWRQEILAGTRVGPPRQLFSGAALDDGGDCGGSGLTGHICAPSDSAGARGLVDTLKAAGADMIKMYSLSKETYFALAAAARRIGIPFGGHLMEQGPSALEASDSGASIVDHLNTSGGLDTLCVKPPASLERCRPLAERFRRNGTWLVPTIIPMRQSLGLTVKPRSDSIYKHLGAQAPEVWGSWVEGPVASDRDPGAFAILRDAGMPILAGTDIFTWDIGSMPGLERLSIELALYQAEGLTPLETLQTATLNPAKMLHATDSLGTVAAGKLADVVLLDADPLADIANVATIRAVVANGRYFDRAALDHMLVEVRARAKQNP